MKNNLRKIILAATVLTMSMALCACGSTVQEEPVSSTTEVVEDITIDSEVNNQVDIDVETVVETPVEVEVTVPEEPAIYAKDITFATGSTATIKAREYNANADTKEVVNSELFDIPVTLTTKQEAIEGSEQFESIQIKIDYDFANWSLDYNSYHYHLLAFDGYTGTYIPLVDPAQDGTSPIDVNIDINGEVNNVMAVTSHGMADDYMSGYVLINAAVPVGYDGLCFVAFPSEDDEINVVEDQMAYTSLDDIPQYQRAKADGTNMLYFAYNPSSFN